MDKKEKETIRTRSYKSFLKKLNNGETTIAEILDDYIEISERIELIKDGAIKAIEDYKNKR